MPHSLLSKLSLTHRSSRPNIYDVYLESCIKNNGGIIDSDEDATVRKLKVVIQHIAGSLPTLLPSASPIIDTNYEATFPDPVKASEDLHSFAKLNENRLYKLMKTCTDPQSDIKSIIKATASIFPNSQNLINSNAFRHPTERIHQTDGRAILQHPGYHDHPPAASELHYREPIIHSCALQARGARGE